MKTSQFFEKYKIYLFLGIHYLVLGVLISRKNDKIQKCRKFFSSIYKVVPKVLSQPGSFHLSGTEAEPSAYSIVKLF